jgi:putative hydrolase of HD superfamily
MSTKFDKAIYLCGALKRLPRKGWVMNKVNDPESVADHSMRTAFLALNICPEDVNKDKAVQMALIHDVAESIVTDITPYDGVTLEDKYGREDRAWSTICGSLGNDEMHQIWREMEEGKTKEAKFVKELDKLEMLITAEEYENDQGLDLSRFYEGFDGFFTFKNTLDIYNSIMERRRNRSK